MPTNTAPAIRTEGLSKAFGDTRALSSLDLEVAPGEVIGYLGPNGAGKTTDVTPAPAADPDWAAAAWLVALGLLAAVAGIAAFGRRDLQGA